jgi:hypothetical protein
MPLPQLVAGQHQVDVQDTAFTADALARHLCSSWEEATGNGGPPFTAVVVGAGMYGAYCAARLYRSKPNARVLLLDAGPFLVGEHVQNLGPVGLGVPGAITPSDDPGVARAVVWGLAWRGNVQFPGLAYCAGGKSLYWGGWCPRLTAADLAGWPAAAAQGLLDTYSRVEAETGVVPATDFISGDLFDRLFDRAEAVAGGVPGLDPVPGGVAVAPLAVQGAAPASGLFSFDKYSSLPVLAQAVRDDVDASNRSDDQRRLFLVPRAHAVRLHTSGAVVHTVEVEVGGARRFLTVAPDAAVILAASAVETTRMALHSFPTPLMGRNLMAHVRSDFTVRIHRSALAYQPGPVETAALLVRGSVPSGRFHLQVTASSNRAGSDELLFRMIPDIDLVEAQLANVDPEWVTVTLRGIGEMVGDRATPVPHPAKSWIDLSPFESDEFGVPRAYVHLVTAPPDLQTWAAMDQAAVALAQAMAGDPAKIQYLWGGTWRAEPFPLHQPFPEWRRGLGTTYHESGTLWMGNDPATSVTDPFGRFHHVANAYACDQSIFPTVGSANPALTGLALAHRLADQLAV